MDVGGGCHGRRRDRSWTCGANHRRRRPSYGSGSPRESFGLLGVRPREASCQRGAVLRRRSQAAAHARHGLEFRYGNFNFLTLDLSSSLRLEVNH